MITKDDVRLVLAYFNLKLAHDHCLHEIAFRPKVRSRFLWLARQILGDVPAKVIITRLLSLERTCGRK